MKVGPINAFPTFPPYNRTEYEYKYKILSMWKEKYVFNPFMPMVKCVHYNIRNIILFCSELGWSQILFIQSVNQFLKCY